MFFFMHKEKVGTILRLMFYLIVFLAKLLFSKIIQCKLIFLYANFMRLFCHTLYDRIKHNCSLAN